MDASSPSAKAPASAATKVRRTAAIALGANQGEPERTFKRALNLLEREGGVLVMRRSDWSTTAPVGAAGQPDYTNGAALIELTIEPTELMARMRRIEDKLGRDRTNETRFGPRVIDLDILYVQEPDGTEMTLREEGLTLPHPRMNEREFVLAPLAEIAPNHVLSRADVTVAEQLERLQAGGGLARFQTPDEAREWCVRATENGDTLGFLPTMGALHEGHLELVRQATRENDRVCVSVFVNPLQFNNPNDLERYPRDLDGDARMLAGAGASMVFTGTLDQFFPGETKDGGLIESAYVAPGEGSEGMEGEFRPGHFRGVATIVDRLFEVVRPTRAYFGAKDFQQCLVVQNVSELRGGTPEIVRCAIVRSPRGLALSSRNLLLSDGGRETALVLSRALNTCRAAWRKGLRDAEVLADMLRAELDHPEVDVEYAEIRDPGAWTTEAPSGLLGRGVALVAANVDGVRLIDNMELHLE